MAAILCYITGHKPIHITEMMTGNRPAQTDVTNRKHYLCKWCWLEL